MKMYLFVHTYSAVNFDRDLATLFCVQEKFSLTTHWRLQGTLLYILGEWGSGFLTL
jgi:hypothetical protein